MTTEQYLKQVLDLLKLQRENKTIFSDKEIEEFKEVKPVPLGVQLIEKLNQKYQHPEAVDIFDFEKEVDISLDYPHLKEVLNIIRDVYQEENRNLDAERVLLKTSFIENDLETFCNAYDYLEELCEDFLKKQVVSIEEIENQLYVVEDTVALRILVDENKKYKKIFEEANIGFLAEELQNSNSKFILIEGESNSSLINLLASHLNQQGKKVFLFKRPVSYEAEGIQISDTVKISAENIQEKENITIIYPIKIVAREYEEDNISYLLEYVNQHYNEGGHINVLGQGYQIETLCLFPFTNKKMTRLSQYYNDKREYNVVLARYGDYLEYISKIYREDCKDLLYKKPTKKFSIVIPARNSVDTLRYTIMTCLDQIYNDEYEVVVSDNSTDSLEVYEFCKELNHPNVVYIKTPRNLTLAKSFEYAYLHARGEYILSIGSDDGVLPWALSVLDEVTTKFPEENVINWPRGFYAWPGFNFGQQNQFVMLNNSTQYQYDVNYFGSEDYLKAVLIAPQNMYLLPLLYINSAFKKSFLIDMYEQLGEIIDGPSQDLYTGLVTIALNEKILNISLALTIAGMSSKSIGANSDDTSDTKKIEKQTKEYVSVSSVGVNVQNSFQHLVPILRSDVSGIYLCLMRAIAKGVFSEREIGRLLDWKKVFMDIINVAHVENITYYQDLYKIKYSASRHGEEFLKWFEENLLEKRSQLFIYDEELAQKTRMKRRYKVGPSGSGGGTWDASEYGVTNIYEAVQLYVKLLQDERDNK